MTCSICTLFEGDYHFGAAVLINSLCRAGFRGTLYAGFRGPLPPWTNGHIKPLENGKWEMEASSDVRLIFILLDTPAHFTNFKPDFMLQVEALDATKSEAVLYLDPDILVNCNWRYIEDWLTCGVALCEDINTHLSENDPKRVGLRRFYQPFGFDLQFRGAPFANGGLVGLSWQYRKFLTVWQELIQRAADSLGGLDTTNLTGGRKLPMVQFADTFWQDIDQDALNATVESCHEIPVSFLGPQAMGFHPGNPRLPHALGPYKPWRRRYFQEALLGRAPTVADKIFWRNVDGPLRPFESSTIFLRRLSLGLGAAVGRFIRRS